MSEEATEDFSGHERPVDEESAYRLLHPDMMLGERITGAAFRWKHEQPSMWIRERLPDQNGEALHRGLFTDHGRVLIQVSEIRGATYLAAGLPAPCGFDLAMTPEFADGIFEDLAPAHATLTGPYRNKTRASALAHLAMVVGEIDKFPTGERTISG